MTVDRKELHWTEKILKKANHIERKDPKATLKDNATFKEVKQYLQDLKDEGHGWLSHEMRKRIKWDIGLTNLTKKELDRL